MIRQAGEFQIAEQILRYSTFVPRLYNLCKSLGFKPGRIMPSRAFCSDENQGYPVILLTKHFGTFPFNHGRVGGVVATDRHGPHVHHGQDFMIIQASHVGYDPETQSFGQYRRIQTQDQGTTADCGKIAAVLHWYQQAYDFALNNIFIERNNNEWLIKVDNLLQDNYRDEGLFLKLDKILLQTGDREFVPKRILSTSKIFTCSETFAGTLDKAGLDGALQPVGNLLTPDLFYFKRPINREVEGHDHLEKNIMRFMPEIISSTAPQLQAAQINTQVEFDRCYRSILREPAYRHRNVLFISGVNIDISPQGGQVFPLTKFVPWAAYVQTVVGNHYTLEQQELMLELQKQPEENPDQIDLELSIQDMADEQEVQVVID